MPADPIYHLSLITCHLSLITISCANDAYEKGEGEYSLMRGDFAEAVINTDKKITAITIDDGEALQLTVPQTAKWVTVADTVYRCMLYYNKVQNAQGRSMAEVISIGQVPCPTVRPASAFEPAVKTDPVKFESAWMSKTGRYLNLRLQLKTGVTDDTAAVQKLGIVADTLIRYPDNTRSLHLRLHHDQGNVPEYYSTTAYLSLPTDSLPADTIHLTINTYTGLINRQFTK